jgi:hypothetical protein
MFELTRKRLRQSRPRGSLVVAVLLGAVGAYFIIAGVVVIILRIEGHSKVQWAAIVILLFFAVLLVGRAWRSWRTWRSARAAGASPSDTDR